MWKTNLTSLSLRGTRSLLRKPSFNIRQLVNTEACSPATVQEGWLFIDSVFPIRLGSWEYASPNRAGDCFMTMFMLVQHTALHCHLAEGNHPG